MSIYTGRYAVMSEAHSWRCVMTFSCTLSFCHYHTQWFWHWVLLGLWRRGIPAVHTTHKMLLVYTRVIGPCYILLLLELNRSTKTIQKGMKIGLKQQAFAEYTWCLTKVWLLSRTHVKGYLDYVYTVKTWPDGSLFTILVGTFIDKSYRAHSPISGVWWVSSISWLRAVSENP